MTDVFISYARANQDVAAKLADDLTAQGYDVWWDKEIISGHRFRKTIERQIKAARAVIVIWSELSGKSDFVLGEAEEAKRSQKLITTRTECCEIDSIPIDFRSLHTISVNDTGGIGEALRHLKILPSIKIIEPAYIQEIDRLNDKELVANNYAKKGDKRLLPKGPDRNYFEAADCYEQAAQLGHAGASRNLAIMHLKFWTKSPDRSFANKLLLASAEKGDVEAMYQLGLFDLNGSKYWLSEAHKLGDKRSFELLVMQKSQDKNFHQQPAHTAQWIYELIKTGNDCIIVRIISQLSVWRKEMRITIQELLKSDKYYSGPIDGIFGAKTICALKRLAKK